MKIFFLFFFLKQCYSKSIDNEGPSGMSGKIKHRVCWKEFPAFLLYIPMATSHSLPSENPNGQCASAGRHSGDRGLAVRLRTMGHAFTSQTVVFFLCIVGRLNWSWTEPRRPAVRSNQRRPETMCICWMGCVFCVLADERWWIVLCCCGAPCVWFLFCFLTILHVWRSWTDVSYL